MLKVVWVPLVAIPIAVIAPAGAAEVPKRIKSSEVALLFSKLPVLQVRIVEWGSLLPLIKLPEGLQPLILIYPR